jgi:NAD(P)-dependent dehydrogenase (short-subunit alcohol dehydrogenase family)
MIAEATGVIIGASGGIGSACLSRLEGVARRTVAVSRTDPEQKSRGSISFRSADISQAAGRRRVTRAAASLGLPLRYLVIASGIPVRGPIEVSSQAEWDLAMANNVVGPALMLAELLSLEWATPASVVMIGSLSANRALPDRAVYGASKAALEHFCRCAAVELAPRQIAVNVVSAGVVDTPFLTGDRLRLDEFVGSRVPAARLADPGEVADVVRYLVTAPSFLTGSSIAVDGAASVAG